MFAGDNPCACKCHSKPEVSKEAGHVNYMQVMDETHCFFCHKTYKPSEDPKHAQRHYENKDINLGECEKVQLMFRDCSTFSPQTDREKCTFENAYKFHCSKCVNSNPSDEGIMHNLFCLDENCECHKVLPPDKRREEWEVEFEKLIWEEYGDDGTNERFKSFIRSQINKARQDMSLEKEAYARGYADGCSVADQTLTKDRERVVDWAEKQRITGKYTNDYKFGYEQALVDIINFFNHK